MNNDNKKRKACIIITYYLYLTHNRCHIHEYFFHYWIGYMLGSMSDHLIHFILLSKLFHLSFNPKLLTIFSTNLPKNNQ